MGGLKRKISTDQKIEKKGSKSVTFSKRRKGLYSKTSQLCLLSGGQAAILVTPPCSKSHVSFYSFGHSSVDTVVSSFLANQQPPREDLGSEFRWWEDDESLAKSEDSEELSEAVDSISRMLQNLKGLRSAAMENREDMKKKKTKKKKELVLHGTHDKNQTLNLQPTCASICCVQDEEDPLETFQGIVKNIEEEDQIVASSDSNNNNVVIHETHHRNQTLDLPSTSSASLCVQDVSSENFEWFFKNVEQKEDQMVAISNSNNNNNSGLPGNFNGFNQKFDLDQFVDVETNSESLISTNLEVNDVSANRFSYSGSEGGEDGAMVVQSYSNKDNLHHVSELNEDKIEAISDNNNNNDLPGDLYRCSHQEVDTDQIYDSVKNSETTDVSMMMNTKQNRCSNSEEAVEDGAVVFHRDLDQDNLQFSDFFNELLSMGEL